MKIPNDSLAIEITNAIPIGIKLLLIQGKIIQNICKSEK